jgi:hypothetical protein
MPKKASLSHCEDIFKRVRQREAAARRRARTLQIDHSPCVCCHKHFASQWYQNLQLPLSEDKTVCGSCHKKQIRAIRATYSHA